MNWLIVLNWDARSWEVIVSGFEYSHTNEYATFCFPNINYTFPIISIMQLIFWDLPDFFFSIKEVETSKGDNVSWVC